MSTATAPPLATSGDQICERPVSGAAGRRLLPLCALAVIVPAWLVSWAVRLSIHGSGAAGLRGGVWAVGIVAAALGVLTLRGITSVAPGGAVVVQAFGSYRGTIREPGVRWIIPWAVRHRVSVKIRSYSTPVLKVNDADGNPIEIGLVVVWQVADTAQAVFVVDDVASFVATQAEIAARQTASSYPYDDHGAGRPCLRASTGEITTWLTADIADRTGLAGVYVRETRITHLRYAPEIAHAMLRRQQADALVAARQKIVDGAVGMVESALARLATYGIVEFDEERKAAMVSNMLVVLCSDQATQPVVNSGTIYS